MDKLERINFFGEEYISEQEQKGKGYSGMIVPFLILLGAFLIYLLVGQFFLKSDSVLDSSGCKAYTDEWVIEGGNVTISTAVPTTIPANMSNGTILMKTVLPNGLSTGTGLMYWSKGQNFSVYCNGDLLYSFQQEDLVQGQNAPYEYHIIPLPLSSSGREIVFRIQVTDTANSIGEMYIGPQTALLLYAFRVGQFEMICAICIFLAGIAGIGISLFVHVKMKREVPLLYLSAGICLSALWLMLNSKIRQFMFNNMVVTRNGAFYVVALVMIPLLLYVDRLQKRRYHKAYYALEAVVIVNYLFLFTSYSWNLLPFRYGFFPTEVIAFVIIGVFIATYARDVRMKRVDYQVSATGLIGLGGACAVHLICYMLWPSNRFSSGIFLFGLLFMLVCATTHMVMDQIEIEREKNRVIRTMEHLSIQAMESLAKTVDAKDPYTSGHSIRVAHYAMRLAARMGMTQAEQNHIYYVGLLHDVGKIGIPDRIIRKPEKLTDEEYDLIKSHTKVGSAILENITEIPGLSEGAHYHHERYDGTGFPEGLKGEEIPKIARLICVADTYDAMTSKRSYRGVLPQKVVRDELVRCSGTQFDPEIAKYMIELIDEDTEYIMHE